MSQSHSIFIVCMLPAVLSAAALLASCDAPKPQTVEGDEVRDSNLYSIGKRSGTIVKFSRKGSYTLSYEGQMILGGTAKETSGGESPVTYAVSNVWEFSVLDADADLVSDINAALVSGERVVVVYAQVKTVNDQRADTDYRIKAVLKPVGRTLTRFNGEPYTEGLDGLPAQSVER